MNSEKLVIEDYYDLLALHRTILEAKFHKNPDSIEVCFSPIVARISNEIVDMLNKFDAENNNGSWEQWRKLENKSYFRECALNIAISYNRWDKMGYKERKESCKNLLSPFIATEDELESFVNDVDNAARNKKL